MFSLFGTRGIKHKVGYVPIIENGCPSCSSGDLENKLYRRWFTFLTLPVIPSDVLDRFYQCSNCKTIYNENIRELLSQPKEILEKEEEESRKIYARALIASMTHMAIIDNDFAKEEEREIQDALSNFKEYSNELLPIYEDVKLNGNKNDQVFKYINEAREKLSTEVLINILAQAAVVLLADGQIEKEEERLMRKYLLSCHLPKSMYQDILDKLQVKKLAKVS
ncbi:MAG: TerB family tellurite resistance protein [Cyclobacteriaceae bacterium]